MFNLNLSTLAQAGGSLSIGLPFLERGIVIPSLFGRELSVRLKDDESLGGESGDQNETIPVLNTAKDLIIMLKPKNN